MPSVQASEQFLAPPERNWKRWDPKKHRGLIECTGQDEPLRICATVTPSNRELLNLFAECERRGLDNHPESIALLIEELFCGKYGHPPKPVRRERVRMDELHMEKLDEENERLLDDYSKRFAANP